MPLNFNKLTLALILTLTTVYSSNLDQVQALNETNLQDGYYYLPPHELKPWEQLTPEQQSKAKELGYNREALTKYILQSNPNTPKWADLEANTTK